MGTVCRPLLIPNDSDWMAIVSGALTELVKTYNWQLFGSVTVDQAVERMQLMIDTYYDEPCDFCLLPGGSALFRLTIGGHIQQFVNGEWVEPEGEYELPIPAEREEPTAEERRCLAAANAANVLEAVYEDLSDSFSASLDLAEAGTGFGLILAAKIGIPFGLITAALIATATAIFSAIYAGLEFISADVWTSDFNDDLKCMLFACSTDDGDTVTFDLECFFDQLWQATDLLDITFLEQRLFYQISVIMQFIGVEGLNVAGGTTEITEAFCNECDNEWCRAFGDAFSDEDWTVVSHAPDLTPTVFTGGQWVGGHTSDDAVYIADITNTITGHVTYITVEYEYNRNNAFSTNTIQIFVNSTLVVSSGNLANGAHVGGIEAFGDWTDPVIQIQGGVFGTYCNFNQVVAAGTGDNPWTDDNCVP